MGVRPPADNSDEPDVIEFGIAALDARLSDVDIEYPATTREVRDAAGHIAVPFDASGHSMTVAEALEETNATEFDNEQELLNDLHPIFERKREATRNSLLSQLRALVPF
ncbi:hypothetical protein Har1130_08860 [Haloarcula sp. CBA1130]|uniref:DUF5789 family protein n=1 Tax=unclassified Haloarcula TaxID=2624677 RepID=UPI0012461EAB|nr:MULTISPECIES: hypothetical protein [unclassified Haloarcula]KAA9397119.1 hypothetical protein Har1129_02210 [Haloarcula sp. CBA1129]KAA9402843.1 hypothetical protein Har1130_08860 [Haloarcula sp. CBA1130]